METRIREVITQISVIVGDSDRLLSDKVQIGLAKKKALQSGNINPPEIAQYTRQNEAEFTALQSIIAAEFPGQTVESLRELLLSLKAAVDQLTEVKIELAKTSQALDIVRRSGTEIDPTDIEQLEKSIADLKQKVEAYNTIITELTSISTTAPTA